MTDISIEPLRPPAPAPLERPVGFFKAYRLMRKNPIETWTRAHFELPIVVGRTIYGWTAVVNDPAAIRRVLIDNAANYRKDELQRRLIGPGLRDGLLEAEGEDWRFQRRTLAPLFTPKTIASFEPAMRAVAEELVLHLSHQRDGKVIDIQSEMARVTLDILGRTIFSDGLGRDGNEFAAATTKILATVGHLDLFDLFRLPDWVPRLSKLGGRKAEQFLKMAVQDLMLRRKRLLGGDGAKGPPDILALLLSAQDPETGSGLSDKQIMSNIRTFIAAGHETTSNALTWSLFLLSQSPQWQDVLAEEAREVLAGQAEDQVARLTKTRAVIEEAMRLYPPAASMTREAIGADDLAGQRIRKGTLVIVAQWVLHRHRRLWADPDCFDPRRFLPEARDKIDRFAYLPFGAGPRICIGASFSMQEAVIILAHLMRAFRFEAQKGHVVVPVQRITLRPAGGMPLILRQRTP